MSSSAAASAYWRVAGMSYLKYSNLCADLVRGALKPELRSKAKEREIVYFKEAIWKEGRPEKQSMAPSSPPSPQSLPVPATVARLARHRCAVAGDIQWRSFDDLPCVPAAIVEFIPEAAENVKA